MEKYKVEFHPVYSGRDIFIVDFDEPMLMQFFSFELNRIETKNNTRLEFDEIKELENDDNLRKAIEVNSIKELIPLLESYTKKIEELNDGFHHYKQLLIERYNQIISRFVDGSNVA
jgi:hypothetical protein